MSLPIVYRQQAFSDLTELTAGYESVKTGLGVRFHDQVDRRLLLAASQPQMFGVMYQDVRAIKVPKFPYAIYYRAHTNRIEVIAIVHGSRDASAWQSQL
jgi:plasmid stabilization system protein ParE